LSSRTRTHLKDAPWPSAALVQMGIVLFYLLLAVALTWPAAKHIGSRYPGQGNDLILFPWQFWRLKRDLLLGESPFYTTLLYHPQGVSLAFSNTPWALFALWLPLQAVVGPIGAYGVLFFVALVGNGYAGYRLFREILTEEYPSMGLSPRWAEAAAVFAGMVMLTRPWILSKPSHFSELFQMGTPLAALSLLRYYRGGRVRDAIAAAAWIAITGLTAWHGLVMGALVLAVFVAWRLLLRRPRGWQRLLLHTCGIVAVAALLVAPFAVPMVASLGSWENPSDALLNASDTKQTDLVAFVAPPVGHPLHALWPTQLYDTPNIAPFLGYAALALGVVGLIAHWHRAWPWGLLSLICLLLALGGELKIDTQSYPRVPMPYSLLARSSLFAMIREPSRWNHTLTLPFAMLAGWGGVALIQALRRPTVRAAAVAMVGAMICFEAGSIVWPYDTMEPKTPIWYAELAQEPGDFAILDLPYDDRYCDKWYMYYQITHGKAIVGGHVSRLPSEARSYIEGSPWLRQVTDRDVMTMDPDLKHVTRELAYLAEADVRYVVLHREFADPPFIDGWADWLTIAPAADLGELLVFRTDPKPGRDYRLEHELADGMGLYRWNLPEARLHQGAAVPVDLRWASRATPGGDYLARFVLTDADGGVQARWERAPSETVPTNDWWENEVIRGTYRLVLPLALPPGRYALDVRLIDPATGVAQGDEVSLGEFEVVALAPEHADDLLFGGEIALLGHDIDLDGDDLVVSLYWRAQAAPTDSYKVFLQAVDAATGEVVAQHDGIPCGWACPTTGWERGEVVVDQIRLPADRTQDATLVVGLYGEQSLERLMPVGPAAVLAQDGTAAQLSRP